MNRDLNRLASEEFDLLVIGGGIYGAWTAAHAVRMGLRTALIDKGDWASGTSSASTKLIHGGLRYLEQFKFGLVRTSLQERAELMHLAPHLVKPLRFCIPLFRSNRVGPFKLKAGLRLYDLLAGEKRIARAGQGIRAREAGAAYPFLDQSQLRGGFYYHDCQTDDFRLTLGVVAGAVQTGAVAANYLGAERLVEENGRIAGAEVRDCLAGGRFRIKARAVVNTAGPWVTGQGIWNGLPAGPVVLSKGIHLVVDRLPTDDALLLMAGKDGRIFFIIPWYGRTLVGTTDTSFTGDPDRAGADPGDVDYLLTRVGRYAPALNLDRSAVISCFAGLRALADQPGKALSKVSREWVLLRPRPGYLASLGGKLTTARKDALKIAAAVGRELGLPKGGGPEKQGSPIPSAPLGDFRVWREKVLQECRDAGLDQRVGSALASRYGTQVESILEIIGDRPELAVRMNLELDFVLAEIVHAARYGMAQKLEDILRRRIPLMILSRPDRETAGQAAALAAPELGWSRERMEAEIRETMDRWQGLLPGS